MARFLQIVMPDASKWAVPVQKIAEHRAAHYAHEFDGDLQRSLDEDTLPLFAGSEYDIEDWAINNMNFSDFAGIAVCTQLPNVDYEEGWCNGEKEIVEIPAA